MMRRERRAAPFFALFGFEVLAIIGLQSLGSFDSMQIPTDQSFWDWLSTNQSVDALAMPLLRYAALGLAYWMLVSTMLFVLAQMTKVPFAIRLASMFTLPSVRRAVDGAMAVSMATTSVVSFGGMAAFAADSPTSQSNVTSIVTSMSSGDLTLGGGTTAPSSGSDFVTTPTFGAASAEDSTTTSSTEAPATTSSSTSTTSSTEAPTTTSSTSTSTSTTEATTTSVPATTSTSATAPTAETTTSIAPSAGQDFVVTPKPGAPITTTTVPQGPSTSATTPAVDEGTPAVETPSDDSTNASEHRVVAGDNLWTIARDAVAQSSGRQPSQISEVEIRTYWLKVIDANRDNLRSHDPHWIFPGEVINLPAMDGSVTGS